ncbi:MAG: tetratricopeptide repeat protein [Myxococcales bacterium]|nr:tetratricopeptide repeat protein [Myxococcales bacterium]
MLAASLLLLTPISRADEGEAETLIGQGVALRQLGRDQEALQLFRRAFAQAPSPRARAQMGLCEQALGIWLKAEEDLSAALAETEDVWVQRYKEPLARALEVVRGRVGSLEIVSNQTDVEVALDGNVIGTLKPQGTTFRVESGTRSVSLKKVGFHSASRTVIVPGGGVARETFDLAPLAPGELDAPRSPGAAPYSSAQRTVGLALLGTSAVVVGAGVAAQLVRASFVSDYNSDALCPGEQSARQPPACQERISSARTWQTVAIVGYAAGAALAISGGILYFTAPPRPASTAACGVGPLAAGGFSAGCTGRF